MLKQGTASDKVSALSMLIERDPIGSLHHFLALLQLAKKPNRKLAESAIQVLRDVFIKHNLLDTGSSKLQLFSKNPYVLIKHANISDD